MSYFRKKGAKRRSEPIEVNYIIDGFLIESTINMIFAPAKQGKSLFLTGFVKWLYDNTDKYIEYYDWDNSIVALYDRDMDQLWENLSDRFDYLHHEELEDDKVKEPKDTLKILAHDADMKNKNYKDTVFMFDSAIEFCDEGNDNSVKIFMNRLKKIRSAGGTVIFLHHTNKNNPDFKGSTVFLSGSDAVYKLRCVHEDTNNRSYAIEKIDTRLRLNSTAFDLNTELWELRQIDYEEVCIPVHIQVDINKITSTLRQAGGSMKQGDLLDKALKTNSTNKSAKKLLKDYEGKCWTSKKDGNSTLYTLVN